jgi:type III secretory pathway component EscU
LHCYYVYTLYLCCCCAPPSHCCHVHVFSFCVLFCLHTIVVFVFFFHIASICFNFSTFGIISYLCEKWKSLMKMKINQCKMKNVKQ